MFNKVGIKEELEEKREESVDKSEEVVDEVRLLLESGANEEKEALKRAKLDHHIKVVEQDKGIEIERKQFEDKYKGHVFTEEEVKAICVKYDLRFLQTEHFRGNLDTEVAVKLKHFMADHNNEIGAEDSSFYIIAPSEQFELEDRPAKRNVFQRIFDTMSDPVLMYRLPKTDNYVFIHKWGKDFTFTRRLRGLLFESLTNMWTIPMSFYFVISAFLLATWNSGYTGGMWETFWMFLGAFGMSFGATFLTWAITFWDVEDFHLRTAGRIWNKKHKRSAF